MNDKDSSKRESLPKRRIMTALNPQDDSVPTPGGLPRAVPAATGLLRQTGALAGGVVMNGVRHIEGNLVPVCICAATLFLAYWVVWKYLFPQPYENLSIRLIGCALCLVVAAKDWWPQRLRRFLPIMWLLTVLYSGPFFFTFMLLQNNASELWLMSTLAAMFLSVLLLDWLSLLVLTLLGSLLAWQLHLLISPETTAFTLYLQYVPVFLFPVVCGTIFNYKAAIIRETKERARLEVGELTAKEMQSPLFGVRTHATSLSKLLPVLIANAQSSGTPLPEGQLRALERLPDRIAEEIDEMGGIIDVLLAPRHGKNVEAKPFRLLQISRSIEEAIGRLVANEQVDHSRLKFRRENDFRFYGPTRLVAQILARVLEAALEPIYDDSYASLMIDLGRSGEWNFVRIRANAFEYERAAFTGARFGFERSNQDFSKRPDLAFANLVMERLGGSLTLRTALGGRTETMLWFPPARSG
jgi:hypothetical protein